VLKQTIAVAVLMLATAGSAGAQPIAGATPGQAAPAYQATLASCQAYEAKMRRTALMNKVLSANYNAQRIMNECMANPNLASQ
jgi:curli biogenesis system outer membrane secretion channel CsgG